MLVEKFLPEFDVSEVCLVVVDASPAETYGAVRETDLRDPLLSALFGLRELPDRIVRMVSGEPARFAPERQTFNEILSSGPGWILLAEKPGSELLVGEVAKFWKRSSDGRSIEPQEFTAFRLPGYAKLAVSFSVHSFGEGQTLLRYEARLAATDESARRKLRRYWRVVRPGVGMAMRRALRLIRENAEARSAPV